MSSDGGHEARREHGKAACSNATTDERRQFRASARSIARSTDGRVIERYGPIDLMRLAERLER